MNATVSWEYVDTGHYRGKYHGRILEIKRNPDGADKRRYVGFVDDTMLPQAAWTIPQIKTKLIRHITRGPASSHTLKLPEPEAAPRADDDILYDYNPQPIPADDDDTDQAVVPYEPSPPPAETFIEVEYVIRGRMRVADFGACWDHLRSTVDMLREWGPADGEAVPPAKIKF